ncbi:MAG: hypothetical protein ACRDZY_15540 [Acidimicrobiales bacterium]
MSDEHKRALAIGREQGRVVRRYLEALERSRPKRGRRRTTESVRRQLDAVEAKLQTADPLSRLHLVQERHNLDAELKHMDQSVDMGALEAGFVRAAREYGERKGIDYTTWREIGVDASVLRRAGITRSETS